MRIDQQLAEKWIKPGSSVLDLGCGDGELLAHMSQKHQIRAYGLEIDQEKIAIAVSRGLNIIQQDLNLGLSRFADQSFDYGYGTGFASRRCTRCFIKRHGACG